MTQLFHSIATAPARITTPAWWFVFDNGHLLVRDDGSRYMVPTTAELALLGLSPHHTQYLGRLGEVDCLSGDVRAGISLPEGWRFLGLRRLFDRIDPDLLRVAVRAVQIVAWDRNTQFCGRCGQATQLKPDERAKLCPNCDLTTYPRISPAIIVAVTKGDTLLLARAHRHPPGFHSVLAGFVEPGETLEEAVEREIKEEVGLEVRNIRYFGSQPWPFPDSLMLAFTAEYAGGEIVLEETEIAAAGWYRAENLPLVPPPVSIARALIDAFVVAHAAR